MTTSIRSDATKSVIQVNGVDKFAIGSQGELYANGNSAGSAGQVLQSGGAGQPAGWGANTQIGVGQTWQDVSGSRTLATDYTNNTGKPISVHCSFISTVVGQADLTVAGIILRGSQNLASGVASVNGIIPVGAVYRVSASNGGTISQLKWVELR